MELKLSSGPRLPAHLSFDRDGLFFLYLKAAREPLPSRYATPSLAATSWETIIFGLESDRFQMRQRFVRWLKEATQQSDDETLTRLGELMGGCYCNLFGGRAPDKDAASFYDWILLSLQHTESPIERAIWARGLSCCPRPEARRLTSELALAYHCESDEAAPLVGDLPPGDPCAWLSRAWSHASLRQASEAPALVERVRRALDALVPALEYDADSDQRCAVYHGLKILLVADLHAATQLISALRQRFDEDELEPSGALFQLCATVSFWLSEDEARRFSFEAPFLFTEAARLEGRLVCLSAETGHVPADHVSALYLLSSMGAGLGDIYFEQASLYERAALSAGEAEAPESSNPKKKTAKDPAVFRERDFLEVSRLDPCVDDADPAWIRLRAYRAGEVLTATVPGRGDYRDLEGVVGFLNNILQYYGKAWRLAALSGDDEALCVLAGTREELRAWRQEGLISFGEDSY